MLILSAREFEEHVTPPGHPERPERAHVFDVVAARWRDQRGRTGEPRRALRSELERVHAPEYLDQIEETDDRAVMLDPDTFTSPESYGIALLAAGAAIQAVEHAVDRREPAFALVRPPGHHAERARAMGFCLYNNVAIAAAAARARGLDRVAVVDIDVHHGNGTQWIFYDDPHVLYISTHQYPFYPGTGAADETGTAEGTGFTVNIPLEAGATDADFALVHRAIVTPVLDLFAPELTIVSAGYDAHEHDPLASMRMTAEGYGTIVGGLAASARRHGALALVTEGGYELTSLAECLEASFAAIAGSDVDSREFDNRDLTAPALLGGSTGRGERAIAAVRAVQTAFWRGL
jgi:acetoin utilization deacetylase AcuC-like enzyme